MQRQEINFYRFFKAAPRTQDYFSWKKFWIFNIIFIFILILIYLFSLVEIIQLQSQKNKLQTTATQLESKFLQLKNTFPPFFFDKNVPGFIENLQNEISVREKTLRNITNPLPFSSSFIILSNIIVQGVWLTQINIAKGGREVTLKGNSLTMPQLQNFIKNIMGDKIFSHYILNINHIENVAKNDKQDFNALSFELKIIEKS